MCGGRFEANATCEAGHFICDACHTAGQPDLKGLMLATTERDPIRLFGQVTRLPGVHMHGPEHHAIVPGILLAVYRNNGGEIDLDAALEAATQRGGQVPGGICGFWGACGAAIGAGIYASVVLGGSPLNGEVWGFPQILTAKCLGNIAELGGPRCCKRCSRIALETAADFTRELLGVEIPVGEQPCTFYGQNNECLYGRCPYFAPENDKASKIG